VSGCCEYGDEPPGSGATQLVRTLLNVSCAKRASDVREPHAARELRCGHPLIWYIVLKRSLNEFCMHVIYAGSLPSYDVA
jgi:hypothetical protein